MKTLRPSLTSTVLGLLLLAGSADATTRNWTGAGPNSFWTTATNWDTYPSIPAVTGDALVFAGTNRLTMTNDYAVITNTMTFNSGGWTLNGNPVWLGGTLTSAIGTNVLNVDTPFAPSGARTIAVTANQLTMNGVISGTNNLTKSGVGTLVLTATNTYSGGTTIGSSLGVVRITNPQALGTGTVALNKAGAVLSGFLQLNLTGTNNITNAFGGFSSTTALGDLTVPCIENISGSNTIFSPLIVTGSGGNGESFKASGGLLTLNGGIGPTITSRGVELNGSGLGVINGPITNGPSSATFVIWKDGTGTWVFNGVNTTTGFLIINNGRIALGAGGSIVNLTIVLGGTSVLDVSAVPSAWTLAAGKTLQGNGVVVGNVTTTTATIIPGTVPALNSGAGATTAGTLTFSNNLTLGGAAIQMNLSSDPSGTIKSNDQVVVAGDLAATGVNNFALGANIGGALGSGTYRLIKFGGSFTGSSNNFSVSGFPTGGRGAVGGFILTNTGSIDLVVTGTPPANLVWRGDGAANNWDITTTSNWLNGVSQDEFYNNDAVTFDDTATNFVVTLPTDVIAGYITVNSTNNYSFNGGAIGGTGGLTKSGSGALTNNNNNTYTGITTISGGTIAVPTIGAGGAASPLGAAPNNIVNQYINGGTLEYTGAGESSARDFSIGPNGGTLQVDTGGAVLSFTTSGGWVATGHSFTKTGPGTVAWTLQQVLDGTNTILGGIFKIPGVSVFGVNLTTPLFINGGALDLNAQNMDAKPVFVSGMGDPILNAISGTTNGAIINSSATAQQNALRFVTLTGDTALGGTGRWDLRANPTASLSTGGNAYNLIKVGANQVSLTGVIVDPALGNVDVRSGILSYETSSTGLGNPAKTLMVEGAATFQLWAIANPLDKKIILADNSTMVAGSGVNTIVGSVNLLGDTGGGATVSVGSGVSLTFNGAVSGAGNLNKIGVGTLTLAAPNSYTGSTTVTAGKLVVSSGQTGVGVITENDGTTLGVTVAGVSQLKTDTLTLGSSVGPVTNEFSNVSSTTIAPINATNLVVNGPTTINILSGSFLAGQIYPLLNFATISGAGGFTLGTLPPLVTGTIITNGNTIALNVSSAVAIEYWTGIVNGNWDINATTNWNFNGAVAKYANGNTVQFDDTASNTTVNVTTTVLPKGLFVNNSAKNYAFSGSPIGGTNSLTKLGTAAVTLSSPNTYSGGTTLSAGTLNINNNAALGSGALAINGGTLDNTGSGPVTVTNAQSWNNDFAYSGNQDLTLGSVGVVLTTNRQITASGSAVLTVSSVISDGGLGFGLTKAGAGTARLSGTNTYSGGLTVNAGNLILAGNQSAASGGLYVGPASAGGTLTVAAGASVSVGVTNLLGATNQIQIGNTNAAGTTTVAMNVAGSITNNGTLIAARTSVTTLNAGGFWLQNGDMELLGVGGYSASFTVGASSVFTYKGTNTIKVNGADGNSGQAVLTISGQFNTPAAFEQDTTPTSGFGEVILAGGGTLKLTAAVPELNPILANAYTVKFGTGTGGGAIDTAGFDTIINDDIVGNGSFTKAGAGTLTLANPAQLSYTNDTFITGGTLVLSNSATLTSTNILIAGGAKLNVALLATQPYVLADYQVLGNLSSTAVLLGSVDVAAAPAALSLTYSSGVPSLNLPDGALTVGATTPVTVNNTGAALGNGNYKLISVAAGGVVAGTAPATVIVAGNGLGAGGTATLSLSGNELYLTVTGASTVNTNPPTLTNSVSGGNLNLSWPTDHIGWRLVMQTNHLNTGLSANTNDWGTVPGSATTNKVSMPLDATKPTEFYRLIYP